MSNLRLRDTVYSHVPRNAAVFVREVPGTVLLPCGRQAGSRSWCHHNIFRHHVRYFAIDKMTVRFQTHPIPVYELVYPPSRSYIIPRDRLRLKNAEFKRLHQRNDVWYSGLRHDLRQIEVELLTTDEADARMKTGIGEITALILRAEREQEEVSNLIDRIYQDSAPTDILALNHIHQHLQDRIVALQVEVDKLPETNAPPPQIMQLNGHRPLIRFEQCGPIRPDFINPFDIGQNFTNFSEAEMEPKKVRRGPLKRHSDLFGVGDVGSRARCRSFRKNSLSASFSS